MGKERIEHFAKYQIRKNHYEGVLNDGEWDKDYVKVKWSVNGEGRAISAMLQLEDNKIIKHRIWSYDSMFEWKRKKQHKEMMLEALEWAIL